MPSRATVHAFIALVEAGKYVEAIERYYAADASMQENNSPPRKGRDALINHEREVMSSFKSMRMEEVALQRWRGDEVVEERFFYDPGQMRG